jgi:plastocyanin
VSTCERGTSTRRGRAIAIALALLALTTLALGSVAPPARAETAEVTTAGLAFSPETVTVQLSEGEPELPEAHAHVNFVMRDEGVEHTVFFDDRSVAVGSSGRLGAGQTYAVVFEEPGTFLYRCEIHPHMSGTVVVTPAAASAREESEDDDGGSGTSIGLLIAVAAVAAGTGAGAVLLVRRRGRTVEPEKPGRRPSRSGGS